MVFILENVRGLLSIDGGETFKTMISELQRIKGYEIHWKVLNTADYGIPQSRKRVFIVGIKKKHMKKLFEWPEAIPCRPLEEFVDWGDRTIIHINDRLKTKLQSMNSKAIFLDMAFTHKFFPVADHKCSCICAHSNFLNVRLYRYMNVKELCLLQGFSPYFILPNKHKTIVYRILGNSISVNVLRYLIKNIFGMIQLV
jgi:DNA (cytosine-5)-methyltransferase 1